MLQYITDQGMFSSKRVKIGVGTAQESALPDVGEYGATQSRVKLFIKDLFNVQKDMNILVLCHSDPPEPGRGKGGPSTVGKKMTEFLPSRFKTVIRLDREVTREIVKGTIVEKSQRVAYCAPHGDWIARINEASATGNPMPSVPLQVNPLHFWVTYDNLKMKGTIK